MKWIDDEACSLNLLSLLSSARDILSCVQWILLFFPIFLLYYFHDLFFRYFCIDIARRNFWCNMNMTWCRSAVDFSKYSGKVVMVQNVATLWGTTVRDFEQMNSLNEKYEELVVLGFPSNQYVGYSWDSEIQRHNELNFHDKIRVDKRRHLTFPFLQF